MDSTEIPVYGEQEHAAYNGHFESTCYHPRLLFNGEGDCLGAKLRPGNVHSAEDWSEVLLPEIERQVGAGNCCLKQIGGQIDTTRHSRGLAEDIEGLWEPSNHCCCPKQYAIKMFYYFLESHRAN